MNQKIYIWVGVALIALTILVGAWFFFLRPTGTLSTDASTPPTNSFGEGANTTPSNNTAVKTGVNGTQTINTTPVALQRIFKIADGPIVGATLIQTLRPTTTVARYIRQDDGHVFDIPLGVAGAVPKVVSNVTIPGGQRVVWLEGGNAAILQYVDDTGVVKTVYLGFPAATTSAAILPTRLQFLPDNIADIAASPDGKSVVYLLKTASGADGYIANSSGINSKKMFSMQLSELLISWPSAGTILVETKSAAGVTGMSFAVDAKSGTVTSLLSAEGLSVNADRTFANIVYQTASENSPKPLSYSYVSKTGLNHKLAFNPIPEKCIWGLSTSTSMYCASPLQDIPINYLDQWHQGITSLADTIYSFDLTKNIGAILVVPGSIDGGAPSDITEMALSPDEHYLSFTTKTARALWGVTLVK